MRCTGPRPSAWPLCYCHCCCSCPPSWACWPEATARQLPTVARTMPFSGLNPPFYPAVPLLYVPLLWLVFFGWACAWHENVEEEGRSPEAGATPL